MFRPSCSNHPLANVVFRLALMMSLWEGPVLWGHSHAGDCSSSLIGHVTRLHGGDCDPLCLGWHWHFSVRDLEEHGSSGRPQHRRPSPTALSGCVECPVARLDAISLDNILLHDCLDCSELQPYDLPSYSVSHLFSESRSRQCVLCRMSC